MKSFEFDAQASQFFADNKFIALGDPEKIGADEHRSLLIEKINQQEDGKLDYAWGTLGWNDDQPFLLNGTLDFSEGANDREGTHQNGRNAITVEHSSDIREINEALGDNDKVWERTLNFDDITFDLPGAFTEDDIPVMRLSLFVAENEGAIVYYQHSKKGDFHDEDAYVEYIQCNKTDDNFSGTRDRLTYYIPIVPNKLINVKDEANKLFELSDEDNPNSFIIKILTFKREPLNPKTFLKDISKVLSVRSKQDAFDAGEDMLYDKVGKDKYRFLVFNKDVERKYKHKKEEYKLGGDFVRVRNDSQIRNDAKTLFIIHGTFVNTIKSYLDIWRIYPNEQKSYLQTILESGMYDQIIALDHPTISAGAHDNVDYLKVQMDLHSVSFTQEVDVITTSRGALIAECISGDPDLADKMRLNKVMMFSAANGSGYFRAGKYISKGLSLLKKSSSGVGGKVIFGLMQMSADFFLQLPGCKDMTPRGEGKSTLDAILIKQPNNANTEYKNIVADWNMSLNDTILNKIWKTPADMAIKLALGWKHDFVIGCKCQKIVPDESRNNRAPIMEVRSIHGGYLNKKYIQDKNGTEFDIHQEITNYLS
jgi:hypothetical protein